MNNNKLKDFDNILFHAAEPIMWLYPKLDDKGHLKPEYRPVKTKKGRYMRGTPTHTLLFTHPDENIVLMTYVVTNTDLKDIYIKKVGRNRVTGKMLTLLDRFINNLPIQVKLTSLSNIIPQKVTKSLIHYLSKVSRYFKLTGSESLIFTGDSRIQENGSRIPLLEIHDAFKGLQPEEKPLKDVIPTTNVTPAEKSYIFCTTKGKNSLGNDATIVVIQNSIDFMKSNKISPIGDDLVNNIHEIVSKLKLYSYDDTILYGNYSDKNSILKTLTHEGFMYSHALEATYLSLHNSKT